MAEEKTLRSRIDHTNYHPGVTAPDIDKLVNDAAAFGFRGVCVNLGHVRTARNAIERSGMPLSLSAIIDFPLGAGGIQTKIHQAELAKRNGASELDTVLPIGVFLQGSRQDVEDEIRAVNEILPTKFIIEHSLLSDAQVLQMAELLSKHDAFCLKLATGFMPSSHEKKMHDVALIRANFPNLKIKASGGIKERNELEALFNTGADIIGTSSALKIFTSHHALSPSDNVRVKHV